MIRIKLVLIIAVIYLPFWLSIEEMQRRICSDISSILFLNFTQGDKMRNSALTRTSGGMGGLEYQALSQKGRYITAIINTNFIRIICQTPP